MEKLTIGQLAKRTHVNLETIRYFERRGLIPEPQRSESGYRQYSADDLQRTRFIKRAQALGFSLKEISDPHRVTNAPLKSPSYYWIHFWWERLPAATGGSRDWKPLPHSISLALFR